MRNKRFQNYPDDTDYTTNAPSYYDDLARKEKLIRLLAERIWGYEEILDETLEEIQERFIAWDKNLEDLPEDLKILLQEWMDNGTFDHIINETIFNWKLDTEIFEQFRDVTSEMLDSFSTHIPIDNYKHLFNGEDVTQAFLQALTDAPKGSTITFNPNSTYELSDSGMSTEYNFLIDKPISIDFNSAEVKLKVNDKAVFELVHVGEGNFYNRIKLLNYNFKPVTGFIPTNIIRINQAINSFLSGSFDKCKASHSLIWNWKGYGTHIRGEARYSDTPRIIYLSHSNGLEEHSFMMDIDIDITGTNGVGIETEGGGGSIKGVIESCQGGGYFYNGTSINHGLVISVHMENNDLFDFKIGTDASTEGGSKNAGLTTILGTLVNSKTGNSLIYGSTQNIDIVGSTMSGTFKPLLQGKTVDTNISVFGSRTPKTIPDPDRNTLNIVGSNAKLKGLTVSGDVTASGDLSANTITSTNGRIKSSSTIKLYPEEEPISVLIMSKNDLIPQTDTFNIGGAWNRFSSVFANKINIKSPDGNQWDITVDNAGALKATKIV